MVNNVKVDKVDGNNVYITIDCSEDDKVLRLPVRRIIKPSKGPITDPTVFINGISWPSFAEYVTKNLQ